MFLLIVAQPKLKPSAISEASSQLQPNEASPPTNMMATKVSPDEEARKPDSLKRSRDDVHDNDESDTSAYTPDPAASSSSNAAEWSSVDENQQRKNRQRMPWDNDDDDDDLTPNDENKENAAAASGRVESKRGRIASPTAASGGARRVSGHSDSPSPTSWLPSPDASPNPKSAGSSLLSTSSSSSAMASALSGPRPAARWGHSATSIGHGRMVVYGGQVG